MASVNTKKKNKTTYIYFQEHFILFYYDFNVYYTQHTTTKIEETKTF